MNAKMSAVLKGAREIAENIETATLMVNKNLAYNELALFYNLVAEHVNKCRLLTRPRWLKTHVSDMVDFFDELAWEFEEGEYVIERSTVNSLVDEAVATFAQLSRWGYNLEKPTYEEELEEEDEEEPEEDEDDEDEEDDEEPDSREIDYPEDENELEVHLPLYPVDEEDEDEVNWGDWVVKGRARLGDN